MRRVVLVGPEIEENLSLRYLASSLGAAGFPVDILALNDDRDVMRLGERILADPPFLVGLSLAFQWRAPDYLALAAWLRQRGFRGHITTGGHFATFAAAELLRDFPELDSICRHEAEETLVGLARALTDGTPVHALPGVACRDADGTVVINDVRPPPDLARLPWPDRRGEAARFVGHGAAPLVGSRGCYAHCSFCCIAAWHALSPGERFRWRDADDVAAEMAALQRERDVDIFVFHDDNFFLPNVADSTRRFNELAEALDRRRMRPFATVVKARSMDLHPSLVTLLRDRLQCVRVYVGVESDSEQGLRTLRRASTSRHNHAAMAALREHGLLGCFNLLLFDPDTTVHSLRTNLDFLERYADFPSNFCRTELYAGSPLLARMQAEHRAQGDYLLWDYQVADPTVERICSLALRAFYPRNFAPDALANRLIQLRFDVTVARHFHPRDTPDAWLGRGRAIGAALVVDGVAALRRIVEHVEARPATEDARCLSAVETSLRACEARLAQDADALWKDLARLVERLDHTPSAASLHAAGARSGTP